MKKELLLIAAAAAMFAACERNDFLREPYSSPESENDGAINFTSFTNNSVLTKGDNSAENSTAKYTWLFLDNHNDFVVWGFKSNGFREGKEITENAVFNGVTVDASDNYSYSPLRFWDKNASKYHFYAAAPAAPTETWTFTPTGITNESTLGAGYWSTTATIVGVNLKNKAAITGDDPAAEVGPDAALSNYFKGTGEIDKLIAAPCEISKTYYAKTSPEKVHLNFIHILSKLNVTITKAATLDDYTVVLDSFIIKSVPNKGDFDEHLAAANKDGNNSRWDLDDYSTTVDYVALANLATRNFTVTTSKNYILESLIIPQNIRFKRVALDGAAHDAVVESTEYYADYEEYTKAKAVETILTETAFNAVKNNINNLEGYKEAEGGNPDATIDDLNALVTEITKMHIAPEAAYVAATTSPEPYFYIKYSINGEDFDAYYNLADAFGSTKVEDDPSTTEVDETSIIAFNEGYQNTLNIKINPTAIEFTADVADWAKVESGEYEIIK